MLAGKFAVITGGGSGIGRAICSRLAEHGAKLVVVDLNQNAAQETIKSIGASKAHTFFSCDVSKYDEVVKLHDFALKQHGVSPNVVVNCAGITKVTQAFAKSAVAEKTPLSIVNISSIVGKVGNFGQCNYAATKAGVVAFGKSVGKELAKKGVRVNTVMPGFIRTPMTEAMPPKVLENICQGIPMGRMGEVDDIADATLFLASDMSKYMTGATLEVTGGLYM